MTAWSRAGSSYVCECRPGYEAVVELSGACAYAAPWGTVERAKGPCSPSWSRRPASP